MRNLISFYIKTLHVSSSVPTNLQKISKPILFGSTARAFSVASFIPHKQPPNRHIFAGLTSDQFNCKCVVRSHSSLLCTEPLYAYNVHRFYSTNKPDCPENVEPEKKPSLYQRFKTMYKEYWYVLLPVHLVTSAGWFGGFYYMASSGFDIVAMLEWLNVNDRLIEPFRNGHAKAGYLAIAYALYKIATPLRYTVTLGGTTLSINYLKRWGWIKPVPSREKLKEIYQDKKGQIIEKGQTIKDNMLQTFKPSESKKKP